MTNGGALGLNLTTDQHDASNGQTSGFRRRLGNPLSNAPFRDGFSIVVISTSRLHL